MSVLYIHVGDDTRTLVVFGSKMATLITTGIRKGWYSSHNFVRIWNFWYSNLIKISSLGSKVKMARTWQVQRLICKDRNKELKSKGPDYLGHGLGYLGKFLGSTWNRQLKFSAYAWFMIFWSLSKFELIHP